MFLRSFNKAWEKERELIESQLVGKLEQNIKELDGTRRRQAGRMSKETEEQLLNMRNELVLRKSMAVFESEEIARHRMQLRTSYLALLMSSVALLISITTAALKW